MRILNIVDSPTVVSRCWYGTREQPGESATFAASKMLRHIPPTTDNAIALVLDGERARTWRRTMNPMYKSKAVCPSAGFRSALNAFVDRIVRERSDGQRVVPFETSTHEAKDVIAAICRRARSDAAANFERVVIYTEGFGLAQLVDDSVSLRTYQGYSIGPDQVRERYRVAPSQVRHLVCDCV